MSVDLRVLHSFPTRRSSDLLEPGQVFGCRIRSGESVLANIGYPVFHTQALDSPWTSLVFACGYDESTPPEQPDRKSTRLNSSHVEISYAVFCLKKKTNITKR